MCTEILPVNELFIPLKFSQPFFVFFEPSQVRSVLILQFPIHIWWMGCRAPKGCFGMLLWSYTFVFICASVSLESQHFTARTGELNFSFMICQFTHLSLLMVGSIPCIGIGPDQEHLETLFALCGLCNSSSCCCVVDVEPCCSVSCWRSLLPALRLGSCLLSAAGVASFSHVKKIL